MINFGASYYPEQLDPSEVEPDARLMRQAGFNLARMGEFAWSRMEPDDGKFDFSWLEEAVETLARHGIKSLLGTPTAAPPKWLTDKHPDILQIMADGRRREFGRRRHYCVNSGNYHHYTKRIVTALAERFKDNPHVIGCQIDNEFMAEQPHCYCDGCRIKFQSWLRKKFGTIEELNRRWGMAFWSQSYRNFGEVAMPKAGGNPSAVYDLYHFFSDSFLAYAQLQTDCLKKISPEKTVTHNVCSSGFVYLLDLYKLGRQLDVISVDNYPFVWTLENEYGNGGDRVYDPAMASFALSMTRSWRHAPFWVTEAQSGRTFKPRDLIEPGILNAWTHQEIAHGARTVLWFHWKQFPYGIEHLLDAVLYYDGVPRRRYFEIQKTVKDLQSVAGEISGALPQPEVTLIRDFHTDWALDDGHVHPDLKYQRHLYLYYHALFENHVNADTVAPEESFARYKVVIAPSLLLVDEKRAANLRAYVEQGGTLVLTCQTGLRDLDNVFHKITFPAHLRDLCGFEIEEQQTLKFQDTSAIVPLGRGWKKRLYEVSLWLDVLKLQSAKPLAHHGEHWFAGSPAVSVNKFGRGKVYYVGTVPSPAFTRELLQRILATAGVESNIVSASSPLVESVKAHKAGAEFLHLINYSRVSQTVKLPAQYRALVGSPVVAGQCKLPPFSAAIFKRAPQLPAVAGKRVRPSRKSALPVN